MEASNRPLRKVNGRIAIGVDPGYGATKVAVYKPRDNGDPRFALAVTPSVVGLPTGNTDARLFADGKIRRRDTKMPHAIRFAKDGGDYDYLVGPHLDTYANSIERMDFDRFTSGTQLALIYASISELLNPGFTDGVIMAVGLPVQLLLGDGENRRIVRGIAKNLEGEHKWVFDSQRFGMFISKVNCKVAQPLGSFFEWGLDCNGVWQRAKNDATAPVAVIDMGYNTIDCLVSSGGQISSHTRGDTIGMRRACELATALVSRAYGQVYLSLHEADTMLREYLKNGDAYAYVGGQQVSTSGACRDALESVASDALNFAERTLGRRATQYRILLTGGGGAALFEMFSKHYRQAELLYQPVTANARGLLKVATSIAGRL